jgi:hypothetical protein
MDELNQGRMQKVRWLIWTNGNIMMAASGKSTRCQAMPARHGISRLYGPHNEAEFCNRKLAITGDR